MVPFSLLWGRLGKWNWGPPTPLLLKVGGSSGVNQKRPSGSPCHPRKHPDRVPVLINQAETQGPDRVPGKGRPTGRCSRACCTESGYRSRRLCRLQAHILLGTNLQSLGLPLCLSCLCALLRVLAEALGGRLVDERHSGSAPVEQLEALGFPMCLALRPSPLPQPLPGTCSRTPAGSSKFVPTGTPCY